MLAQSILDEVLQLPNEVLALFLSLLQDDEGLDHLAPLPVRLTDRRRHEDVLVPRQGILDLRGAHPVAGGDDEVVVPAGKAEEPLLVYRGEISGLQPIPDEYLYRRFFVVPVPEHHNRVGPLDGNLTPLTWG